jgi:transglutaminase-like putative cysteine protease
VTGAAGLLEGPPAAPAPARVQPPARPLGGRTSEGLVPALLAALATVLTSTGMTRVFDGFAWWFLPCIGAVLTATICGLLARLARVPLLLLPAVYAIGLAVYVPAVSAPATRLGPFPTTASWTALRQLAGIGGEDVRRLAVPVPQRPGLVLLVVLGTYAVACAVDVICTRLHSPAMAGLPLLALLAVPAAIVPGDVGLVPFLAGAVGYLLLLAADGRRSIRLRTTGGAAGRSAGVGSGEPPPARRRGLGTVRIGLLGLVAAVLVPALLPGAGRGLLVPASSQGDSGLGNGNGRARVVQPFVTLDQQLRSSEIIPLLRVRTDTPEYLRLTALDNFDGARFSLGRLQATPDARVRNGLPAPSPGVRTTPASGQVRVQEVYRQRYLPVPFSPTSVSVSGDWRLDGPTSTVFSGRTDTGGTRYSYTAAVPTPTAADLRSEPAVTSLPADVGIDLRLPALDPDVRHLAQQLTAELPTTYAKVAAIQQYLRSPLFTYDLNGAPTNGRGALRTFLLETRRGYCEQFASAMAVLVRAIGVPARVAIGFTPGSQATDGEWVITNRDAHAWPEVWFPQAGWVRFEPTPRDDSSVTTPDYSVPPPPGTTSDTPDTSSSTASSDPRASGRPERITNDSSDPGFPAADHAAPTGGQHGGPSRGWLAGGAIAVLLGALLAAPPVFRLGRRRRRLGSGRRGDAWREVSDTANDLGVGSRDTESPRASAQRWSGILVPVDADGRRRAALLRLARDEERARFAAAVPVNGEEPGRDGRLAVDGLEQAGQRAQRVRAWLLPRSLGRTVTRWSGARRADVRARFGRRPRRGSRPA